jgi:hypothetical protein
VAYARKLTQATTAVITQAIHTLHTAGTAIDGLPQLNRYI